MVAFRSVSLNIAIGIFMRMTLKVGLVVGKIGPFVGIGDEIGLFMGIGQIVGIGQVVGIGLFACTGLFVSLTYMYLRYMFLQK